MLTVDKDLARIAELLVAYSGMRLQSDRYKYATSIFVPAHREYERDLEKALFRVAYKGSLGVLKVLVFSPVGPRLHMAVVLRYAVKQSHLALAKYLIEEWEVNVMAHFPPATVGTGCCSKRRDSKSAWRRCVAEKRSLYRRS